ARASRRHTSGRPPRRRVARELLRRGLYLGSSAEEGVGCDDTRGPTFDVRPVVDTIPSDQPHARGAYPWIAFEGRWGSYARRCSTGKPGRTSRSSGRRRSAGRTVGARAATPFPAEAHSDRGRPDSSVALSATDRGRL